MLKIEGLETRNIIGIYQEDKYANVIPSFDLMVDIYALNSH